MMHCYMKGVKGTAQMDVHYNDCFLLNQQCLEGQLAQG